MLMGVALAVFVAVSFLGPVTVGGYQLKTASFAEVLMAEAEAEAVPRGATAVAGKTKAATRKAAPAKAIPAPVDTAAKTILLIGDSMLDGLSPRLSAYAKKNGHTLYTVIWYSSTSEVWGKSDKLRHYIKTLKPNYIFICLGANELFVRDIRNKRTKYVRNMLSDIGRIPYIWIGPPNWKPDTGVNEMLAAETAPGTFFLSNGMTFTRKGDGAHPTNASAAVWLDSVVRWMPRHAAHPIRMELPEKGMKARPKRIFLHRPDEH